MNKKNLALLFLCTLIATTAIAGGQQEKTEVKSNELKMVIAWEIPAYLIEEFEDETGISVNMEVITGLDDYKQTRNAKIAAGEDVDIITSFDDERADFIKKGYYYDLSGQDFLDRLISGFHNAVKRYSGDLVPGVSFETIMLNVWYNKTRFQELGLDPPQNFQDFLDVCDSIVAAGETPLLQGGMDQWPIEQDLWLCFGNTPIVYPDWSEKLRDGSLKWNDGYLLERFKRAQRLFQTAGYYIPNTTGISYDQAFMLFAKEEALMWAMGSWATEVMLGAGITPDFEIGAFAPPCNDTGVTGGLQMGTDARLYSILSSSPNVDNALKFFEFMTRKDVATRFAEHNLTLSTIKGVEVTSLPAYEDFAKILQTREGIPFMAFTPAVSRAKSATIQSIALGDKSYKEITDEWQAAQEEDNSAGY